MIQQSQQASRKMDQDDNTSSSSIGSTYFAQHFENVNNIYELQSVIHHLTIQKQKSLILYHNALSTHNQEKSSLIKQINNLENTNHQLNNQNQRLNKSLDSLRQQYREIKKSHENLEQLIESIPSQGISPVVTAASLDRSRRQYQQVRKQCSNYQQKLREVTTKLTDAKSEIFALRSNYEKQLNQLQQGLQTAREIHEHEIEKLKNEHKNQVDTLNQHIQYYKAGNRSIEGENSAMISQISELHKRINQMQVRETPRIPTPAASPFTSKAKYRQLLSRFENLIQEHSLSIQNEKSLAKQLQSTRALCSTYAQQILSLEKRLTNTSTQYRVVNYTEVPLIAEYTQPLLQQLTELKQFVFDSEKTKLCQQKKINELLQQIQCLKEGELKQSEREMIYLRQKNKNYEKEMEKAEEKIREILQENENNKVVSQRSELQNMRLKQEVKDMQIELQQLKALKRVTECEKCYTFESQLKNKVFALQRENRKLLEEKNRNISEINEMDYQVMLAKKQKFEISNKLKITQQQNQETTRLLKEKNDQVEIWRRKYYQLDEQALSQKAQLTERIATIGTSFLKRKLQPDQQKPQKSRTMAKIRASLVQPEDDSFLDKQNGEDGKKNRMGEINSVVDLEKDLDLGSIKNLKQNRRAITDRVRKEAKQEPYSRKQFDIDHFINSLKKQNSELKALIE